MILFLPSRSTSDRSGKDCCGQWFNGPPLRFLVILVALGGVACKFTSPALFIRRRLHETFSSTLLGTLGGATLGSIALAGSPTSHLTAGLLMTGKGFTFSSPLFSFLWLKESFVQCKLSSHCSYPFHDS